MTIREDLPIPGQDCRVEDPPPWWEPSEPDWEFDAPGQGSIALLLVDEQQHVPSRTVTNRIVRKLLTPEAVARFRELEIEFDATTRRFSLHDVTVWRQEGGALWEPRRLTGSIRFQSRPSRSVSGRVTMVATVEGLGVGDALDLTWSLKPTGSAGERPFGCFHAFVWSVPCGVTRFTIHDDPAVPVRFRMNVPEGVEPPRTDSVAGRSRWTQVRPPVARLEPNAPPGVWNFPMLEASAWHGWDEVAAWVHRVWKPALEGSLPPGAPGFPESVPDLVRFVQEKIGNLEAGTAVLEMQSPALPDTVLRRGEGTPPDKAALLTVLLRGRGVDAVPLLVNPDWQGKLGSLLPTPGAFNHVVVRLVIEGRECFVDPSERSRPGPMSSWAQPSHGFGLPVVPRAGGLAALPPPGTSELTLKETFHLARDGESGWVEQHLRATRELADEMREVLERDGQEAFIQAHLGVLREQFPALTANPGNVTLSGNPEADTLEMQGRHRLPEGGSPGGFRYRANGLLLAVEWVGPEDPRTVARALRHPMDVRHEVRVEHPGIRAAAPEKREETDPAFHYSFELTRETGVATIVHRWQTTAAEVEPSRWPEYVAKVNAVFAGLETVVALRPGRALAVPVRAVALWAAVMVCVGAGVWTFAKVARSKGQAEMQQALDAATQGDLTSAEPLLEKQQEQFQENPAFQFIRAEVALRMGQLDRARQALERAKALDPENVNGEVLTAALHRAEGNDSSAREILTETIERNPNDPRPMRELALTLAKQGDRQGAMNAWAKVLEIVPGDADALRQYAVLLWQNGEQAKADAIIRQALEGQTTPNANLEAAAGDYYTLTGRRAEALQRLEKAATLDPEDRTRDFALASGHLRMGRAQEAADVASRLTRDFPTDVRAWQVLAVAKSILGDRPAAETAYREWLRLAPQDPKGPANFGFFLHQSGRDAEARDLLAQSSVRFPREGMIWLNYATVLDTLGDTQAATAARQQASNFLTAEEKQLLIR
ncbi:MAG: tetratricopeptide repeat protein [Verrucomicrobia bacterium]|nr:tetratricopeptide repeat protein [Verrucomicrobiota bacterium]